MLAAGQKAAKYLLMILMNVYTNTFDNINKSYSGTRMLILRFYHLTTAPVGYENLFSQMSFFVRIRVFSRDCLQLAGGT
jgi:hypothetical protein